MRDELPTGTVTFLFTDVEGSTRLLHELGPDAYATALTEHRRLLRTAYGGHGGVEVDTQGDAFFFAFPTAQGALDAAAEGGRALAGGPISVRVGIHTGTPMLTDEGYVGEDVHTGARVGAAGHGGQVLVSKATRGLVDGEFVDLGEHRLQDLDDPVWIYQLGTERFPPLKTISNTNLPRPANSFVGREPDVAAIVAMLGDGARLLTLVGPGGSGKTRLAIEAATELIPAFPNGVFWVDLAPLRDPALVMPTVAEVLGGKGGLDERIGERAMLLLLDNLEQVLDCVPGLSSLIESCPRLRLLVTSRELLRVRGEVGFPVQPLAEQEAVELFCARSGLDPDETIAELCRRLDDLPLAVELAAARTDVLSPSAIVERLSQRLDLLQGGRDAESRQRTLRSTVEWSHDLLDDDERRAFAHLSVFRGGFTLDAAGGVAAADLTIVGSLVSKSLLRRTGERFWMLETIRDYARERFEGSADVEAVRRRHAEHFLALAEASRRELRGPDQVDWLHRLTQEGDNMRAALEWALRNGAADIAFRFASALEVFWIRTARDDEAGVLLDRILALNATPSDRLVRARALATRGVFAAKAGSFDVADAAFDECIPILRASGDVEGLAFALRGLAWLRQSEGRVPEARAALEGSVPLFIESGQPVSTRLSDLGMLARAEGDLDAARSWYERALEAAREEEDLGGRGTALELLGELSLQVGDLDEADRRLREALEAFGVFDDHLAASTLYLLAEVAVRRGRMEEAGQLVRSVERLFDDLPRFDVEDLERSISSLAGQLEPGERAAFERGRTEGQR